MALRTITKEGDPILRKVCRPVTEFNERLWTVLDDMADTMHNADGVGLAGPQVSYLRRVVVIDVGEGVIEMVNPEIVEVSKETQYCREGCLSVPGKWGMITRPQKVKAKAQDRNGNWFEIEGQELLAQAICHELEHLDGHLFIDIVEEWVDPDDLEDEQENQ